MPEQSGVQEALPPPVGYWTRGISSASFLPVSTSKKCNEPCSLPPSDNEIAMSLPSGEGTNQSMAVVPLLLYVFGSKTTRACAGESRLSRRIKTGCCAGGFDHKGNTRRFLALIPT